MPKHRSPQPLYRLCVAYAAKNILWLCPPHDGVSNALPPAVSEDLMLVLNRVRCSNLASLQHLLTHRLRRIELRFEDHCPHPPDSRLEVLSALISQHGEHLVDLSLEEFSLTGACKDDSALVDAVSKLPKLRRLSLCLPNVSDLVLVAIAEHCAELRELRLSGGRVTDGGLCRLVACSQLHTLLLETERYLLLTVASTLKLVRELRHLRALRLPCLDEALLALPRGFRLPLLADCTMTGISVIYGNSDPLLHIVSVCPHLTCVTMHLTRQDNIEALAQLKALTELTLRAGVEPNEDFFHQKLEPVLRTVGPNLRRLVLSLQYLDLATISRSRMSFSS